MSRSRSQPLDLTRRDLLRAASVAGVTSLAGCASVGAAVGDEPLEGWSPVAGTWPLDGYDTQHSRYSPDASPPSDPSVRWRDSDPSARFVSLVVDDAVFVGGSSVRAYDPGGSRRWKCGDREADALAVHDGSLYVADNVTGVTSLAVEDGSDEWSVDVEPVAYGLLPTGDRLFVALHDRLLCLDAETGETRWAQWMDGGSGPTAFALDDALYSADVGSVGRHAPRGVVERLRDQPPAREWEATRELSFPRELTVADGTVFVADEAFGDGGGVTAFTAADGAFRWNTTLGRWAYSPALVDDLVVVGAAVEGEPMRVVALDRADGSVRWRATPPHGTTSVVAADGVVVTAGGRSDGGVGGGVSAYSLDGERQWTVETGGGVGSLALVDDRVYAVTWRGDVYALADS